VIGSRLEVHWRFSRSLHRRPTVETLAQAYVDALRDMIAHCLARGVRGYTPSDFSSTDLSQDELDNVLRDLGQDG
jgi:non-ribosomal peptide synthase protein (TIGR01720 family)